MGEPDEVWEERIRELTPYKVTKQVMENAGEQAIFLHCLPAFHDLETVIGKEMRRNGWIHIWKILLGKWKKIGSAISSDIEIYLKKERTCKII